MQIDLTSGPVMRGMLLFALPMIAGNLLQQCYNIADTLIVGRYLGTNGLAAVGSAFSLMTFVTSVILGLCMGSGALFSIQFGRRDRAAMTASIRAALLLIGLTTAAVTAGCYLLTDALRGFLRVPDSAWEDLRTYVLIVFAGIPAVSIYNFGACILRAVGNSVAPLIALAVCAALNVVLDLWFVAGLGLGVGSAAAATVTAQWVSAAAICAFLFRRRTWRPRQKGSIRWADMREVASFSFLTCLQQSVMNLGILMVQGVVNSFGVTAMAAFAAAVKIDAFAYMPVQDFGNAFSTFTAQNYGAGSSRRIRKGLMGAVLCSAGFSVAVSAVVCVWAAQLMGAFVGAEHGDVIARGAEYLRTEGPFYFAIGILFLLYGLYRAVGRPGFSVVLTVFSLGTRVALAYWLSATPMGITGVWWSVPIGWFLADAVGLGYFAFRRHTLLPAA